MDISRKTLMRRAGLLKEGQKITFKGTKTDQLYRIVKDEWSPMIIANGKQYAVDAEVMRSDLQNPVVIAVDDDGEEHEINVSDIEFIQL